MSHMSVFCLALDLVVGMAADMVVCTEAGKAEDFAGTVDMDMGKEVVGTVVDIQADNMD